jgi:hypothetical protein
MLTFLKMAAVLFCMTLIIPLAVWGGSGNWRHALAAFKTYLKIMGCIYAAGFLLAGIFWLASLGAS